MSAPKHTPGPWEQTRWGNNAFEIQGGGRSIAIVGRVQARRLDHLNGVRSKAAQRGGKAHQAEAEAKEIEAMDLLPDAKLIAQAPRLAAALANVLLAFDAMNVEAPDRETGQRATAAVGEAQAALRDAGVLP